MITKLSELVKSIQGVNRDALVSYAWHKSGGGSRTKEAFVLALSGEVLRQARFREGDTEDVEFGKTDMTINLGDGLPFSCTVRNKTTSQRQIKVSAMGIMTLQAILPNKGRTVTLDIIQIDIGKIRVRLPAESQI